jgi:hypothetical protein
VRRLRPAALAALTALAGPGCATVVRGSDQYVTVTSRPGGATARAARAGASCRTPCSLILPRKRAETLSVEAPGYRTARVPLQRSVDPLVLWNLILPPFSILWAAVDLASGAGYRLEPTFVSVELAPEPVIAGPAQLPSASCASAE